MIERLRLRNFRRHGDAALRFESGMNFIEGPNNVGKTTALFAIEYALFGRVENFKTIRALMQPGKRSLGVELQFQNAAGERFRLQRIHQMPPKSKKTLEGHFTLKALLDDGEKYLLASDFGDTEDKLALMLQELTGLTRRFFCIALHMRQGEIPAILDGSKQLDIVLGVTAAAMAEEELRQMALELEKESAGLAVLQERIRSVGNELAQVLGESNALSLEQKAAGGKLAALGESDDPRPGVDRRLAPLLKAIAALEERQRQSGTARQRLADELDRRKDLLRSGAKDDLDEQLRAGDAQTAAREKTVTKLRGELEGVVAEEQHWREQRGDLAGRIDRRQGLPKGKGAKCEVCGAAIDAAQTKKELAQWTGEIDKLDQKLAELHAAHTKLQEALDREDADERRQLKLAAQLKEQRDALAALDDKIARRQTESAGCESAEQEAFAAVQSEATGLTSLFADAGVTPAWDFAGARTAAATALRDAVQLVKQTMAERIGRRLAERTALTDLLQRFETQAQALARRQADLEREQAAAKAEAGAQQLKAARAERLRGMSAAFKEFQVQVRNEAASKLAADTLALHRRLSQSDEFESLTIDPAQYSMQVVPRELGEEVPAALYEGGGQRLLLGLAYRLAVARLVERCPVLLLDEPTYGLDSAHREALLDRLGHAELARQVLLVTHHARPELPGNRVNLTRQNGETVVQ